MNLTHDWLGERASRSPDAAALITTDGDWSFAELNGLAWGTVAALRAAGAGAGARVALLAGNAPATVAAIHAVPRLGATLIPLNTRLQPDELSTQLALAKPRWLVHDRTTAKLAAAVAGDANALPLDDVSAVAPEAVAAVPGDHQHTILFTSGTTGAAKGVILSAGNHYHSAIASMINLGVRDDDRWLCCVPLFHVAGLSILIRSAIFGIPVVLQPGFEPAAANAAIDAAGVTIASLVPTMLSRLLDAREGRAFPTSFRCALTGGGALSSELLERCAAAGAPVTQTYGLTETASQVVTLPPDEALSRLGSAGKPLWGTRVRIMRNGRTAGPDQPGEIHVSGPTVMSGYLDDPEATAAALDGGWLLTGDIGCLDADGYLRVLDRRTDLIISGGENIYPAEVEATLLSHPGVAEAAVVGVPDADWGQRPLAFVVPRGRVDEQALAAHASERLARYKCPDAIVCVDELPRTAAGKLQRHRLREPAREIAAQRRREHER